MIFLSISLIFTWVIVLDHCKLIIAMQKLAIVSSLHDMEGKFCGAEQLVCQNAHIKILPSSNSFNYSDFMSLLNSLDESQRIMKISIDAYESPVVDGIVNVSIFSLYVDTFLTHRLWWSAYIERNIYSSNRANVSYHIILLRFDWNLESQLRILSAVQFPLSSDCHQVGLQLARMLDKGKHYS